MFYKKGLNFVLSFLIIGFGWANSTSAQESDSTSDTNISNSSRDLLLRPSQPQEVRIEGLTSITLEQAIDIALENNRDLQRAKLELQRSNESLRAAQARKKSIR